MGFIALMASRISRKLFILRPISYCLSEVESTAFKYIDHSPEEKRFYFRAASVKLLAHGHDFPFPALVDKLTIALQCIIY